MEMQSARDFAVSAHSSQRYGDRPYETHLRAVVAVLSEWTDDPDLIAAGWLHDTIEDTEATRESLAELFGERVARVVHAVTGEGGNRAERAAAIYRKVQECPEAALVKLADRVANIEAALPKSRHRAMYAKERKAFRRAIGPHVPDFALERLSRAY